MFKKLKITESLHQRLIILVKVFKAYNFFKSLKLTKSKELVEKSYFMFLMLLALRELFALNTRLIVTNFILENLKQLKS